MIASILIILAVLFFVTPTFRRRFPLRAAHALALLLAALALLLFIRIPAAAHAPVPAETYRIFPALG